MALLLPNVLKPPVRTVTYYSSRKGKRKTVKAVIYRFLRLHSGLWLRRKVKMNKKDFLKKLIQLSIINLQSSLIYNLKMKFLTISINKRSLIQPFLVLGLASENRGNSSGKRIKSIS